MEQTQQQPQPNLAPMTAATNAQSMMALRAKMQELQGQAQQEAPATSQDPFAPQQANNAGELASKQDDNAAFLQDTGVMAQKPRGYDSTKMAHYIKNLEKDPAFHEATQEGGWWTKVETLRGLIQAGHASPQEAINALMETEPELMGIAEKHHPHGGPTHHRSMLTHPDLHEAPRILDRAQQANLGGM